MWQPSAVSPITVLSHLQARARAAGRALPGGGSSEPESGRYLGLRLADTFLLATLGDVLEVLPMPERISLVPGAKPWLYGIAQVRGALLTVIDLAAFLGGPLTVAARAARVLVIARDVALTGLLVDEVLGVERGDLEPLPFVPGAGREWLAPMVRMGTELGGRRWGMLDLAAVASDPDLAQAAA